MPQQPGDRIPKAWTADSILALVEPRIKSLIKRIGDLGGDPVDHGVLSGLADDDHVQYLIDLPSTGGDGITVTTRTIAVDLTDNTIMAKVGAAAAGPLSMPLNTVLIRAGGDIVALSMPQVFDESGSILVRDAFTPTPDIKALVVPKNRIISTNSAGNWRAQSFAVGQLIRGDPQGGLESVAFGGNRWVITNSSGNIVDLVAITDWMLVGVGNAPTFLISAANALVGKFGTAATAFNVIGAESLALRGSGSLASITIPDSNFVGRPVAGSLGAVTPVQSRVMLALKYTSFLDPPGLHADTVTTKTSLSNDRTYFQYVGKAGGAITTCVIVTEVATAYDGGIVAFPWAQVGIFVGAFGTGATTVTRVGFTNVLSTFNSIGRKVTIVALTGIVEGDDLWVAFGSNGETDFQLRGLLPDKIRSGVMRAAIVTGDLDELPDPTTAILETDTFIPAWIGVAI